MHVNPIWPIYKGNSDIRLYQFFLYEYIQTFVCVKKFHTNIFGYSFVSFSWHEYIRIFVHVKIHTNVTLWYMMHDHTGQCTFLFVCVFTFCLFVCLFAMLRTWLQDHPGKSSCMITLASAHLGGVSIVVQSPFFSPPLSLPLSLPTF